jgi:hypothetical protein
MAHLSPTDALVAESERLRLWLEDISAGLGTFSAKLAEETRLLREEEDDDEPGQ